MYTSGVAHLPHWVHEFRQWHVDMFAVLTDSQQARVHMGGNWVVFPYGEFERLDPTFVVPLVPLYIPFPPHLRPHLAQFSATILDGELTSLDYDLALPGPSTRTPVTRSQTRAHSTGMSSYGLLVPKFFI